MARRACSIPTSRGPYVGDSLTYDVIQPGPAITEEPDGELGMGFFLMILVGTPVLALALTFTAQALWRVSAALKSRKGRKFAEAYLKFLSIAAAYVLFRLFGLIPVGAVAITVLGYRLEFTSSWVKSIAIGLCTGVVAAAMFRVLLLAFAGCGIPVK